MKKKGPVMLIICDGFGIRKDKTQNAILGANMKNYQKLLKEYPHTELNASGLHVGVTKGQIGSSEVGHLTLGAGRLIKQPLLRVNEDIKTGKLLKHPLLKKNVEKTKKGGNVHLMGLLGPGGVHAHCEHLYELLNFFDKNISKVKGKIYIHNFLDGRDVAQKSALPFLKDLEKRIKKLKHKNRFVNSTLCGRYYAMDRDKRWARTQKAYEMLTKDPKNTIKSFENYINESYKKKITDEFIEPAVLELEPITSKDLCIFYNFRSDRPRQLMQVFLDKEFKGFKRKKFLKPHFITLTEYSKDFNVDVLYPTIIPKQTLGETLSKKKIKQLRISESEKFPHVTYFFNGLRFDPFPLEEQVKIPSPKVATYDLKPEMSARKVTRRVVKEIKTKHYDFILLNFANSDMVGHTGNYKAAVEALKVMDECFGKIKEALDSVNGTFMLTADHGNCEEMRDSKKNPHTKHTLNRVPFLICDKEVKLRKDYSNLSLFNVAPTLLDYMSIRKPKEMDAESLLK